MTGKQIANNLRRSRRGWVQEELYDGEGSYCVLGLKAHEAGISDTTLMRADDLDLDIYRGVKRVFILNDAAECKQDLIKAFDSSKYRNHNFRIEQFIQRLRRIQERLRKED